MTAAAPAGMRKGRCAHPLVADVQKALMRSRIGLGEDGDRIALSCAPGERRAFAGL